MPVKIFTEEDSSIVNEDVLLKYVNERDVSNVKVILKLLSKENIKLSEKTELRVYELLSFYNGLQPIASDAFEERYQTTHTEQLDEVRAQPVELDYDVEEVYKNFETKTPAILNARIRHLIRCNHFREAKAIFEKLTSDNAKIDLGTFNDYIRCQAHLSQTFDERIAEVKIILALMNERSVKPNARTLNSILDVMSRGGLYAVVRELTLGMLAEFKSLGIEPTLGTWSLVVKIFNKDRTPITHILIDILNEIEKKPLEFYDLDDIHFFARAMRVCFRQLRDLETAKRVDRLLNSGDNLKFMADPVSQSNYYHEMLMLMLTSTKDVKQFDEFTRVFDEVCPNLYSLDIVTFSKTIEVIDALKVYHLLPHFYSVALISNLIDVRFARGVSSLIDTLMNAVQNQKSTEIGPLDLQFANIAKDVWTLQQNIIDRDDAVGSSTIYFLYSGRTIGYLAELLCRVDRFDECQSMMETTFKLKASNRIRLNNDMNTNSLRAYIEKCIHNKEPTLALNALEFAVGALQKGAVDLACLINDKMTLDENALRKLRKLVGSDSLKKKESVSLV